MTPALLLIAGAASLGAPSVAGIIKVSDYPDWAIQKELAAAATVDVTMDLGGRIIGCKTGQIYGDQRLGATFCDIIRGRRGTPGRDIDGKPVFSRVTSVLRMFTEPSDAGIASLGQAPDAVLTVQALPGRSKTAEVEITLQIEPTGTMSACGRGIKPVGDALVNAACSAFRGETFEKLLDEKSQPIRYLTIRKVQFKVG